MHVLCSTRTGSAFSHKRVHSHPLHPHRKTSTAFELIPSAVYLCGIPLVVYLVALIYILRARIYCQRCPGYKEFHRRRQERRMAMVRETHERIRGMSRRGNRGAVDVDDTLEAGGGLPPRESRRRLRAYMSADKMEQLYWTKHHDDMKVSSIIKLRHGRKTTH